MRGVNVDEGRDGRFFVGDLRRWGSAALRKGVSWEFCLEKWVEKVSIKWVRGIVLRDLA